MVPLRRLRFAPSFQQKLIASVAIILMSAAIPAFSEASWTPTLFALYLLMTLCFLLGLVLDQQAKHQRRLLPPHFLIGPVLKLRRLLMGLADRLVPAELPLFERSTGVIRTELLRVAAQLKIADLLQAGPLSGEELASRTQSHADALHRVMRGLVSIGVFSFTSGGLFQNNRLSLALRSGALGSFREFAEYFGSASNVKAWAELDLTVSTGSPAFERVHGMSVWQWFDTHHKEQDIFAGSMTAMTELDAPAIARAGCFYGVQRLCDVAGSKGTLLAQILAQRPVMRGVLFEREGLVETARSYLRAKGLEARTEVVSGDFFQSVPRGCDAYMMKNILHDYNDDAALQILKTCRQAMEPGARLFIIEMLIEPYATNEVRALSDLQMMNVCNGGRERSRARFEALLSRAGFRLCRVLPTSSLMHIIESAAVRASVELS